MKSEVKSEYQLINLNMPKGLKESLDSIVKSKCTNRTAVINELVIEYCRAQWIKMRMDELISELYDPEKDYDALMEAMFEESYGQDMLADMYRD